ncbi:MAG: hypothetical protein ABGY43_19620 [bacterium]
MEDRHTALERCKELPPDGYIDIHVATFIESESAETFDKTFQEKSEWLEKQVTP